MRAWNGRAACCSSPTANGRARRSASTSVVLPTPELPTMAITLLIGEENPQISQIEEEEVLSADYADYADLLRNFFNLLNLRINISSSVKSVQSVVFLISRRGGRSEEERPIADDAVGRAAGVAGGAQVDQLGLHGPAAGGQQ